MSVVEAFDPNEIRLSDNAVSKVRALVEDEGNPALKLRVYITGGGCSGFQYGFSFDEAVSEDDMVVERGGATAWAARTSLTVALSVRSRRWFGPCVRSARAMSSGGATRLLWMPYHEPEIRLGASKPQSFSIGRIDRRGSPNRRRTWASSSSGTQQPRTVLHSKMKASEVDPLDDPSLPIKFFLQIFFIF